MPPDTAAPAEKSPRPKPQPSAAAGVVIRLAKADAALKHHKGPMAGPAYERKIDEMRSAYGSAVRLGHALSQETSDEA